MPYQFDPWEESLEPQPSSSRRGVPPRKSAGIGVLDPPGSPARPSGSFAASFASFLARSLAWLILAVLVAGTLLLFWRR